MFEQRLTSTLREEESDSLFNSSKKKGEIQICRCKILRPVSHPTEHHSFVGTTSLDIGLNGLNRNWQVQKAFTQTMW